MILQNCRIAGLQDCRIAGRKVRSWLEEHRLVAVCPDVAGGLATPRPAAEITTSPGGRRVLTQAGRDVTSAFEHGAAAAALACAADGIRVAILKDGSPSCGSRAIHDGSFSGRRVGGQGFTAARLAADHVAIFSEDEIEAAAEYVETLERLQAPGMAEA
jgi:uncharacterized protein YbbK (DUF523 family)